MMLIEYTSQIVSHAKQPNYFNVCILQDEIISLEAFQVPIQKKKPSNFNFN